MIDVIEELKNVIKRNKEKYLLYNGNDVLFLPLHAPVGIPMLLFMKDFFEKYISLLVDSAEILKELQTDVDTVINNVNKFREAYIKLHKSILSGDSDIAYQEMSKVLGSDNFFIKSELKNQGQPLLFYRARSGINWTQKEDFYHIPFDKTYLCNSYRFSIAGYPSLYIGYSKEVCKKEAREKACSCIELMLKDDSVINVVDLTWTQANENPGLTSFLQAYPIIAACYVVPFYCKNLERECPDIIDKQTFREQYIFPQFVTMFIKKNLGVDGIIYFTTRDKNLDPRKNDDKNIALFTKYEENILYDKGLIEKFKWDNITII